MFAKTKSFLRDLWALTKPYWQSDERWRSGALLVAIVGMSLGSVGINVLITEWNNDFYNALQDKNETAFWHLIIKFTYLALIFIFLGTYQFYLQQMLQIRWRRWLTDYHLQRWMSGHVYYRLQLSSERTDNPDQRISEDIARFVDATLTLSLGLLSAVVTVASYTGMLWVLSGTLTIKGIDVPGYLVWAALIYSAIGTWLVHLIGRPLIRINFQQQQYEANFRYSLVRLRENAEGVALYKGEAQEQRGFGSRFGDVVGNWWNIMRLQRRLNFFTFSFGQIATVFPFMVVAPKYFSGAIALGGMMQVGSAFTNLQGALSWFVGVYGGAAGSNSFTEWKAVVDRLTTFEHRMDELIRDGQGNVVRADGESGSPIEIAALDIALPDGRQLLHSLSLELPPGSRTLVTGPSGSGKSTLFRTLGGLWPYAKGTLTFPAGERALFLPQKPYLPIATLRAAVAYPDAPESFDDRRITQALTDCGLETFAGRLDEEQNWSQVMSPGEQQRLAIARALLVAPRWLFLDEATSALDEALEAKLYGLLVARLPDTAIVSIAHRPALAAFHNHSLTFAGDGEHATAA